MYVYIRHRAESTRSVFGLMVLGALSRLPPKALEGSKANFHHLSGRHFNLQEPPQN